RPTVSTPEGPWSATMGTSTTVIAPVGPDTWRLEPPNTAASAPAITAVASPASAPSPEDTPKPSASGRATTATVRPASRSRRGRRRIWRRSVRSGSSAVNRDRTPARAIGTDTTPRSPGGCGSRGPGRARRRAGRLGPPGTHGITTYSMYAIAKFCNCAGQRGAISHAGTAPGRRCRPSARHPLSPGRFDQPPLGLPLRRAPPQQPGPEHPPGEQRHSAGGGRDRGPARQGLEAFLGAAGRLGDEPSLPVGPHRDRAARPGVRVGPGPAGALGAVRRRPAHLRPHPRVAALRGGRGQGAGRVLGQHGPHLVARRPAFGERVVHRTGGGQGTEPAEDESQDQRGEQQPCLDHIAAAPQRIPPPAPEPHPAGALTPRPRHGSSPPRAVPHTARRRSAEGGRTTCAAVSPLPEWATRPPRARGRRARTGGPDRPVRPAAPARAVRAPRVRPPRAARRRCAGGGGAARGTRRAARHRGRPRRRGRGPGRAVPVAGPGRTARWRLPRPTRPPGRAGCSRRSG